VSASEYACLLACALYCRYVLPLLWALYAVLTVVNVLGFCCSFLLCWGCPSSALLHTGGSARRRTGGGRVASRRWVGGGQRAGKWCAGGGHAAGGWSLVGGSVTGRSWVDGRNVAAGRRRAGGGPVAERRWVGGRLIAAKWGAGGCLAAGKCGANGARAVCWRQACGGHVGGEWVLGSGRVACN